MGRGPARPIIFLVSRPDPAHGIDSEAFETRAPYSPARHFRGTARGFDRLGHGPADLLSRTRRGMHMR